jgi:hypothetical protein
MEAWPILMPTKMLGFFYFILFISLNKYLQNKRISLFFILLHKFHSYINSLSLSLLLIST